ncbi:hypothetical protein CQW23_17021 [Capsicum baccatum]|uniref:Ubiquitin-like protease family profile domain-containing protein n=1 Tax=Capsicum baccatum TaxID=33114 RepID=A0A2G2WCK7_CAPBA|nr:hypothetical protein CQW23_17021 [Capsicum baccatum]
MFMYSKDDSEELMFAIVQKKGDEHMVLRYILDMEELNHLDLPNLLIFGPTDDDANVAQVVVVQQQSERTALTEFGDEFDDFSTPPSVNLLKKMRLDAEEKLSLSKSDLDEIKSYVKTYVAQYPVHESEKGDPDIEGDPPQSLNEHKTDAKSDNIIDDVGQSFKLSGNEGAVEESLKEAESSYIDKLQEDDRHNTNAEVDEGIRKECVKSLHNENVRSMKVASMERSICEIVQRLCIPASIPWHLIDEVYVPINGHRGYADEIKELAEMLSTYLTISNFFEKKECIDWSLLDAYNEKMDQHAFDVHIVDGIVQQSSSSLDCSLFLAIYAEFLSDRHQIPSSEFDPKKHRTRYASLLWDYGVNKACTGYISDNQNPPRPKRTFIPSEDTEMIDVEP